MARNFARPIRNNLDSALFTVGNPSSPLPRNKLRTENRQLATGLFITIALRSPPYRWRAHACSHSERTAISRVWAVSIEPFFIDSPSRDKVFNLAASGAQWL